MPRRSSRGLGLSQLGGAGERYHVGAESGNPRFTDRGGPKMAWRYGEMPTFTQPHEVLAATANIAHSISQASPGERAHGEQWYPKVHEAVSKGIRKRGFLSGASDKMLTGSALVAAVSPNMDWDKNNIGAFKELASLKSSHWAAINRGDKSPVAGMSINAATVSNLQKAGRLIAGADPNAELHQGRAPKTHSFMHNISNPSDPGYVTIDGRAFDTMTNRMRSWEVNRGLTGGASMNKRYTAGRNIWQAVAGDMGIHPSAAQAISWSHTKYDLEQTGRTRKQGPNRTGQPYFHPETGAPALHAGQFGR